LDFVLFGSSSHCNVFLATLRTMCHLSLGVWTNILSICLFVLFVILLVFVYISLFLSIYKFFFFLLLCCYLGDLHRNCGLYVISVFDLFEQCISLEIPVFDPCVGLERLHLFDCYFTCTLAYGMWGMKLDLKSIFLEIRRLMRCVMINLGFN
jgi:hypothetical protein